MPTSRGARWPIGKNCTNSMSTRLGAGAQRERVTVAAHVDRGAVAGVEARQPARGNDRRLRVERQRFTGRDGRHGTHARRLREPARSVTRSSPTRRISGMRFNCASQGLRDRRAGVDEVDVDAARAVVSRRLNLPDVLRVSRPADAPAIHLADAFERVLAEKPGERRVAQAAPGFERVGEVVLPVVGRFLAERAATVICAMTVAPPRPIRLRSTSTHLRAGTRGADRRVHAGPAGADDEDLRLQPGQRHAAGLRMGVVMDGGRLADRPGSAKAVVRICRISIIMEFCLSVI